VTALGAIAEQPEIVAIVRRMTEPEAVANALGITLPQPLEKRIAMTLAAREHGVSMLQACFIAGMRCVVGLTIPTIDMVLDLPRLRGIREA